MKETIQHGRLAGQGFDAGGHPDADQMTAFVEQALPAHAREEMLAHLAVCGECRATVAMSLPPEAVATMRVEEPRRRAWFAGWGWVWPAGAALAALAVFAVYLRHEAVVGKDKTEQVAVSHAPEFAEQAGRSLATTSSKVAAAGQKAPAKVGAEERRRASDHAPALMTNQPAAPEAGVREEMEAPASQAAAAPVPKLPAATGGPLPALQAGVMGGNNALKKAEAVRAELTLPSGLQVLSMASQGQEVLAIDARNAVFLSVDAGQHWRAVAVRWAGRAVKAETVSYGGGSGFHGSQGGRMAALGSVGGAALPRQPVEGAVPQRAAGERAKSPLDALRPPDAEVAAQKQASGGQAQSGKGRLTGTVTDRSGAAVPGATVTVSDEEGKPARTVVTDRDGGYLADGLAPGAYDVKTEATGFAQQVAKDVVVQGAEPAVKNVTLNVGASTESVEVTASAPVIETESAVLTTPAARKAKAKAAAAPVFAITTDRGEQWTSADGMEWKKAGTRD